MKRSRGLLLGFLALSLQTGCLIWPFPTGDLLAGRGRITPQYVSSLRVGASTREDVLLHLGEPDEVVDGGKILVYRWTEARGFIAVAGSYGGGVVAPFPGHRALRLEFGPDARLVRLAFERGTPRPPAGPVPRGES
ncbi:MULTISPECIES: hypothetical protein [Geothrix]|uniref:hypothetical protein n=1 Tax=Geothrix TaxID=44675 RepID=UPI001FAE099D|nr:MULTISPECIES: hypothetical protein [Geothrix]